MWRRVLSSCLVSVWVLACASERPTFPSRNSATDDLSGGDSGTDTKDLVGESGAGNDTTTAQTSTKRDEPSHPGETNGACVESTTRPCSEGGLLGNCAVGRQTCRDGAWSECSITPTSGDSCASPGDDADCDGSPNGGCACTEGETLPCGPKQAIGICKPGKSVCVDGSFRECEGAVNATTRDCSSSNDNDCDGVADNAPDSSCECIPGGPPLPCDEHPSFDGNGPCKAGSRICEAGADGATSQWGDCTGAVGPAPQDSCIVLGDDANCNGEPNDGCSCTIDTDCDDDRACTANTCTDGTCQQTIASGSCLIDGNCVDHNSPDPSNPCRFCDATLNQTGWTNHARGTSCDDGLWCTGTETCDGGGICTSEFPNKDRCRGTGACDRSTCDEAARSCYESGTVCDTGEEFRCRPGSEGCGGIIESRRLQRLCNGTSSSCTGALEPATDWEETKQCADVQMCTADTTMSSSCATDVECVAFCDPVTGVCWADQDVPDGDYASADTYCKAQDWAGRAWRLPTAQEWVGALRGCQSGVERGANLVSQCQIDSESLSVSLCDPCDGGKGPDTDDNGCYRIPAMSGPCVVDSMGYWTSTPSNFGHWLAYPLSGYVSPSGPDGFSGHAKCVTTQ